jgi:pimeloyl-ACP methyl ester carboxylesterase
LALLKLQACQVSRSESSDLVSVIHDENARTFGQIEKILKNIRPNIDEFKHSGPIPINVETQLTLSLPGGQSLSYDSIAPKVKSASGPLVILIHGNRSYKEAHRYQAEHLASFGFQVFIPQLPTSEVWSTNGIIIKDFVDVLVKKEAENKPILVGHSFGGSAITMAAYLGTSISGLVYIDPAIFNNTVANLLWNTRVPAILIGADPRVYRSKKRWLFRQKYGGSFFELSVKGATHNDGQYPSMFALSHYGLDPRVSEKNQKLISFLITASVFSLIKDQNHGYIKSLADNLISEGVVYDIYKRGPLMEMGAK